VLSFSNTVMNASLFSSSILELMKALTIFALAVLPTFAAAPDSTPEMARITRKDTPAHKALTHFRRGANLGNYLEAPRGQNWGVTYSEKDFEVMKKEGFDHARLPIRWNAWSGPAPEFKLEQAIYDKADFLVTNALKHGLNVIVNIHHFDEFTSKPAENTEKFYALWRQIAEHYAKYPDSVAFELLNEPKDAATTAVLNPIYAEAIKQIRKTNPTRTIFVGPSRWNSIDEVPKLRLPDNDQNLIVTVHCYDPFLFTHQGASWAMPDAATKGIIFPGPPREPMTPAPAATNKPSNVRWFKDYNTLPTAQNPSSPKAFKARFEKLAQWSDYYGRPIHLGEFGAYEAADPESRARFYKSMRQTAEQHRFGWAIWDWKAGFKYWTGQAPAPGLREALFGR
jgi:endoglucanase